MTDRAKQLSATAARQIAELIDLLPTLDDAALRSPCPGREKLGDGTIGAAVRHTVDNYERIADFAQTSARMSTPGQQSAHRVPRLLRALGHGPGRQAQHGADARQHDDEHTADSVDICAAGDQLSVSRDALARIAELTDSQLDAIPPDGSFRFCDGQRTLEQVIAGLLKHQSHQVDALTAAVA